MRALFFKPFSISIYLFGIMKCLHFNNLHMNPYEDADQAELHASQEEALAGLRAEKADTAKNNANEVVQLGFFARMAEVMHEDEKKYADEMNQRKFEKVKATGAMLFGLIPILGGGAEAVAGAEAAAAAAETAETAGAAGTAAEAATATEAAAEAGAATAEATAQKAAANPQNVETFRDRVTSKEFRDRAGSFLHELNPIPDVPPMVTEACAIGSMIFAPIALIPPMWQYTYSTYREARIDGLVGVDMGREVLKYAQERIQALGRPEVSPEMQPLAAAAI